MKVLYSALFKTGSTSPGKEGPVILTSASELSSFGYFQRSTILEMFTFFARAFAKNVTAGARTSVKHEGYLCHLYASPAGVTAVCFADAEYPARVAFGYLSKVCEDFVQATGGQLSSSVEDNCMSAFQTKHLQLLKQFQDPSQADQLTKIMNELEQTNLVLHETIEAALERGQKIDTLIDKSNDLSGSSKMFYKTAKKAKPVLLVHVGPSRRFNRSMASALPAEFQKTVAMSEMAHGMEALAVTCGSSGGLQPLWRVCPGSLQIENPTVRFICSPHSGDLGVALSSV